MAVALNWLWQGCVVAIACVALLRSLERAHANVRYVVCWIALLCVLALPFVAWLHDESSIAPAFVPIDGVAVVSLPDTWWTSTAVMLAAWAAWAGIGTLRFLAALATLRRLRAGGRAFPWLTESSLACWSRARATGRPASLVVSDAVPAAAVLGGGHPVIAVAPALLTALDDRELDRVLIHEWMHVQRRDDVIGVLQTAVRIVAGWHPAVWLLDRRLRLEREIACDEATVAMTGVPKSYAECLVKLADLRGSSREVLGAPAVLIASDLRARVTRILSRQAAIAPARSRALASGSVVVLCALSLGITALPLVDATALALPLESIQIIDRAFERVASAAPVVMPPREIGRAPRRTLAAPSLRHAPAGQASASDAPAAPQQDAVAAAPAPPPSNDSANIPPLLYRASAGSPAPPAAQEPPPAAAPSATVEQARTPWAAAADGGTALGKKSKNAGIATAGAFSRFGRRIAGAF